MNKIQTQSSSSSDSDGRIRKIKEKKQTKNQTDKNHCIRSGVLVKLNALFSGGQGERKLLASEICQFPQCKYSQHDQFQDISMMSLNVELRKDVYNWVPSAGSSTPLN